MQLIQTFPRFAAVLAGFVLVTSAIAADNSESVLARIGKSETITSQDLAAYLDRRIDLRPSRRNVWGVQAILREMALARTLGFEGDALGVPRLAEREKERFDDIYAQAIHRKLAKVCEPLPDAAAARKYFEEHPQAFRVPPMARLSRVMLPASEKIDGEQAMAWLMVQAEAIASGKQKFEEVATRAEAVHKLDPQGDLGWVTLTDDAPILRALASAKQGELVGPVLEGDFAYLFQLVTKRESRQLAWDEVAVSVPTRALSVCRQEANDSVREQLFKKYGVEIDQGGIKALFSEAALVAAPKQ